MRAAALAAVVRADRACLPRAGRTGRWNVLGAWEGTWHAVAGSVSGAGARHQPHLEGGLVARRADR